jgi:hypothetical protein
MYPNSALPAWQLAVIAVVAVAALAAWLIAVYLADRTPGGREQAAAGSPAEPAASGTGSRPPAQAASASAREPERPPADRAAA